MLKNIKLDPAAVNDWILQIGRDECDPQDVAEDWVKSNKETVDAWINGTSG